MRRSTGLAGIILGCLLLCAVVSQSQGIYPVSVDDKVRNSSLIVEGKVIGKKSFWNRAHTMIYTSNEVEVFKVFKGSLQKKTINVITVGGAVDNYAIQASHLLTLKTGQVGIFFCEQPARLKTSFTSTLPVFRVYGSSQGFLKYDLTSRTAHAPYAEYSDIEKVLYPQIQAKTGRSFELKNSTFSIQKESKNLQPSNSTLAPVITSFNPGIVNAGALLDAENNELTINGSGFGTASGSAAVLFSDADASAGSQFEEVPYNSSLIISWTSTRIRVKVPTKAGTGVFRVRDNAGNTVTSSSSLEVRFSILTADFESDYGIKQFTLGNMNGNGGYSIKYSTSTANSGININASPAKATFQRALTTWKESVGVNFVEAGNSSLQKVDPDDGENLVMYDNGGTMLDDGPLGDGVLATCFSGITICTNNHQLNQARKTGFDIVIRNTGYSTGSTAFTLGPCPPFSESTSVVDLESVLLHELGHALNLGHIVDPMEGSGPGTATPAKVMHYSVAYNLRRISLDYAAKAGAEYQVTPHSYTYGTCVVGSPEMMPLTPVLEVKDECPDTFPQTATPVFTSVNFDLVHATSNKLVDPAYNQMTTNGAGVNITNNAYYPIRTGPSGGDLSIEVQNYITSPGEIADCSIGSTGIDVTGVRVALYRVASCPDARNYPTPVAYRTFAGNGVVQAIPNLTPNTSYLMVVDGIQNTKAVFDMVLAGEALPSLSTDLTGEVIGDHHHLTWTTDPDFEATSMILERSADGVTFKQLEEITGDQLENGEYSDVSPLPGVNYYRLRVQNSSGMIEYSRVVSLSGIQPFTLKLYPNPATSWIYVEISSDNPGTYGISLHNVYGQRVVQRQVNVVSKKHVEPIYVGGLSEGMYFISAYGKDGKRIKGGAVKVQ